MIDDICSPDDISFKISDDGHTITFEPCGWTSCNPNDVRQRYCAACHRFMDLIMAARAIKKEMFPVTDDNVFMPIWTVYDHPIDFPDVFVARRSDIVRGKLEPQRTDDIITAKSLQAVREMLPIGLTRLPRHVDDDPKIVEVWI